MKLFTLTKSEKQIMELLWNENRPLSAVQICELLKDKVWKESSIHIFINSLLKKGAIVADGFVQSGKNYARTFVPDVTPAHYLAAQIYHFHSSIDPQKSIKGVISAIIDMDENRDALIEEVDQMLKEKRMEISQREVDATE